MVDELFEKLIQRAPYSNPNHPFYAAHNLKTLGVAYYLLGDIELRDRLFQDAHTICDKIIAESGESEIILKENQWSLSNEREKVFFAYGARKSMLLAVHMMNNDDSAPFAHLSREQMLCLSADYLWLAGLVSNRFSLYFDADRIEKGDFVKIFHSNFICDCVDNKSVSVTQNKLVPLPEDMVKKARSLKGQYYGDRRLYKREDISDDDRKAKARFYRDWGDFEQETTRICFDKYLKECELL